MSGSTERDLWNKFEELRNDRSTNILDDLAVEWRNADPENRPTGMSYDAENGMLAYDVWSAQRETLDELKADEHDIVAFLAGYGAGKSVTGARWLIHQALTYPDSRFLALGVDFTKARDATFRILFKNLPGERTDVVTSSYTGPEMSPIVADYNRAEHRLTLVNDTVLKLGSADKWNRYAGDEYGAIWMDEPSHYGEDLHDLLEMMGSRLRGVDGPKTMFWTLTGNGYNAAWNILEKRQNASGDPIGLEVALVRASTLENPYLDPADKERFKRQYGGTGREEQALYGGFAAAQGLVYTTFQRDTHVIPHADAVDCVDNAWRVYGYDYGWNDPRVLLEIGKTSYEQLVVLDEYHERETHIEDAVAWLTENSKPKAPIYCDHDPEDIKTFKRAGYPAKRATKDIDEGIAEVRKRLELDGNLPVDGPTGSSGSRETHDHSDGGEVENSERVGLFVSENCPNLIHEFLGYKEEHVGTSQAIDHCVDSLRYACMGSGASGDAPTKHVVRRRSGRETGGSRTINRPKSRDSQ